MPPLPQELLDLIVDHLSDDWRALAACAQAHPDLAPRARSRLQNNTILITIDLPNCPDIYDFLRIFSPSSSLITAVSTVSICGQPNTALSDFLPLPKAITFDHLPHLRSLTLRSFLVADCLLFVGFITRCESLETLDLESLSIVPAITGEVLVHSNVGNLLPRSILPKLKTLRLRDCKGAKSASFYSRLAHLLTITRPRPPVQRLSLHFYCPPSQRAQNLQIDEWYETISGMVDSLVELNMTLPIPLDQFPLYWNQTRFPSAIVRCHRLRRLTIRYEPITVAPNNGSLFILALAAFFASAQTVAHGPSSDTRPFQQLEVFTTVLLEPILLGTRLDLGRLAHVLATDAFPALGCVRIGLQGSPHIHTPETVERIEAMLEPLEARGISTEVVGLRAEEWEAWCMALPVGAAQ